jgi:hypothetical protein
MMRKSCFGLPKVRRPAIVSTNNQRQYSDNRHEIVAAQSRTHEICAALLLARQMVCCKLLNTLDLLTLSVSVSVFQGCVAMQTKAQHTVEATAPTDSTPIKKQHGGKRPGASRALIVGGDLLANLSGAGAASIATPS